MQALVEKSLHKVNFDLNAMKNANNSLIIAVWEGVSYSVVSDVKTSPIKRTALYCSVHDHFTVCDNKFFINIAYLMCFMAPGFLK